MSTADETADEVVVGEVVDLPEIDLGGSSEENGAPPEAAALLDDLRRVAADFENFRKRTAREREDLIARASQRLVERLLPVLDSFDSALSVEVDTPAAEKLQAGIRSTHQQLLDVLRAEGLEVVGATGKPFDPEVHEAVAGGGTGHLVVGEELRRGYLMRGRVIRPALVAVTASDPSEEPETM